MKRDALKLMLEVDLDHLKRNLAGALKDIHVESGRALEALKEGVHSDTRLVANKVHIDAMSSDFNRLTTIMKILEAEEQASEDTPTPAPAVSSPARRVPRGGGRRP